MIFCMFFFFNHPATSTIYTLSLHDALPIYRVDVGQAGAGGGRDDRAGPVVPVANVDQNPRPVHLDLAAEVVLDARSEEHTSELQSRRDLVCRLLLEKKKKHTVKKLKLMV